VIATTFCGRSSNSAFRAAAGFRRSTSSLSRRGATSLPVTEEVAARSVFLPMFAALSEADQTRVIEAFVGIVTR
jgi:dTDP-4-amino-4,6-dideoxygalactose transaminase